MTTLGLIELIGAIASIVGCLFAIIGLINNKKKNNR